MNAYEELRKKILPVLQPYVKRISVFGSFARGESTLESDIDLMVELKSPDKCPRLGLRWFGLQEELSQILGRNVDLVSEDVVSPYIHQYVEKEKVVLYEEG